MDFQLTLTCLWKSMFKSSQVISLLTYTLLKCKMWHSTTSKFPASIKSLLISSKKYTQSHRRHQYSRLVWDSKLCMFFADNVEPYRWPPYWIPSLWMPPERDIPKHFQERISNFVTNIYVLFKKKRNKTNLMFFQQHAFHFLRQTMDFVILKTDKNLGLAILERDMYVQRALQDHLSSNTYQQLTTVQAQGWLKAIK